MRVFVAGSTGVVGGRLVPRLLEAGHEVVAFSRSRDRAGGLEALGATVATGDALDPAQLRAAIRTAEPEVVVDELTAIRGVGSFKHLDRDFAATNRLRTEATATILEAAARVGARRVIVQSFCGWPFAREGGPVKTEEDPIDPHPPASFRETLAAIRLLEDAVSRATGVEALALRYGFFYGPGTSIADDGWTVDMVRRRKLPIVGSGAGVWSFIHVDDIVAATLAAMDHGEPGLYNVVDDEPAPVSAWLPFLARSVDAPPPRRVPAWLARLAIGEGGVSMMTSIRGGSNVKAKRELAWQPAFASWRRGFVEGLG